jgi:hypothetical protein
MGEHDHEKSDDRTELFFTPSTTIANSGKARATDDVQSDRASAVRQQVSPALPGYKQHVVHVFGGLPPPREYLDQTVGNANGEVRFAFHPNGDVSAHRWNMESYGWQEIGLYIASQNAIFGELASQAVRTQLGLSGQP